MIKAIFKLETETQGASVQPNCEKNRKTVFLSWCQRDPIHKTTLSGGGGWQSPFFEIFQKHLVYHPCFAATQLTCALWGAKQLPASLGKLGQRKKCPRSLGL